MKIGDYVRTKDDGIQRIVKVTENNCFYRTCTAGFDYHVSLDEDVIGQPSPNILDLIEPQDLMYIDIDNDYAGGIIVPRVAETMWELERYIDRLKNKEVTLVGIVTHEQLNNCMYKVVK